VNCKRITLKLEKDHSYKDVNLTLIHHLNDKYWSASKEDV